MHERHLFGHIGNPLPLGLLLACLVSAVFAPYAFSNINDSNHEYALSNGWEQAENRLSLREQAFDDTTKKHLDNLVREGSSCLEIGPGSGSITHWLAARVGADGKVTAIDQQPLFSSQSPENVEIIAANILDYDFGENQYDVIFSRDVFEHLPKSAIQNTLDRLASALKPGGHILIEGTNTTNDDCIYQGFTPETADYFRQLTIRIKSLMDFDMASRLPFQFQTAGLVNIHGEKKQPLVSGDQPFPQMLAMSIQQMHSLLIKTGEEQAFQELLQQLTDPQRQMWIQGRVWVSGQKPL